MKAPPPEHLLAVPLLLYIPIVGILRLGGLPDWTGLGLLVAALPIIGAFESTDSGRPWVAPATLGFVLVLVALLLVSLPAGFHPPEFVSALYAGALLGIPIGALGELLRPENPPGTKFLLLALLVVEGLAILAAPGTTPAGLSTGFLQAIAYQATQLGAWSTGASAPALPLTSVSDPWFVGLGLIALAGGVSALLRSPPGVERVPRELLREDVLLVLAALGGAAAFEVLALARPTFTLLGMAIAALATVALTLVFVQRRRREGRVRAPPLPDAAAANADPPSTERSTVAAS